LTAADPALSGPEALDFGQVWLPDAGVLREAKLEVTGGRVTIESVELPDSALSLMPIGLPRDVAAGDSLSLWIEWAPVSPVELSGAITVHAHAAQPLDLTITLAGTAGGIPDCAAGPMCTQSTFDPTSGTCVQSWASGPCDDGDPCTVADACGSGVCHGREDGTLPGCGGVVPTGCDPAGRAGESPFAGRWFEEIWAVGEDDVWAVGKSGTAVHWDGSDWTVIDTCVGVTLYSVWGATPDDVWAVGGGGTVLHWDGESFSEVDSNTSVNLWSVSGGDSGQLWAVGDGGKAFALEDGELVAHPTTTTETLFAVWPVSDSLVWVAGNAGTVRRYDGATWSAVPSGTTKNLFAMRGAADGRLYVAGSSGTLLKWSGSSFSAQNAGTNADLFGVWVGDNDLWVSGDAGTLRHQLGSAWDDYSDSTLGKVYGLWGTSDTVWFAGSAGDIVRWYDDAISPAD
jgi:hypothetical protein